MGPPVGMSNEYRMGGGAVSICLVLPLAEHQYYNENSQEQGLIGLSWREDMPERHIITNYSASKPEAAPQQTPSHITAFINPIKLKVASLEKSDIPVEIGRDPFVHRNVGLDLDSFRSVAKGKRQISSSYYDISNLFDNIYHATDEDLKLLAFYGGILAKAIQQKPQSFKNIFTDHNFRNNEYAKRDERPGSVKTPETMRLYCDPCLPFSIIRQKYRNGYFWIPEICFVMVYEDDICISLKYYQQPKISSTYKLDYPLRVRNNVVRDAVKTIAPQDNIRYLKADMEYWSIEAKYDSKRLSYFDLAEQLWDAIYASMEKEFYAVCKLLEIPAGPATPEKFADLIRKMEKDYYPFLKRQCSEPFDSFCKTEEYKRYQKYFKSLNPIKRVEECEWIFTPAGWGQKHKADVCGLKLRSYQRFLKKLK
jgi:hypothetical protein